MSINDLCNSMDEGLRYNNGQSSQDNVYQYAADPDVQMAAEALGGLRNGRMYISTLILV